MTSRKGQLVSTAVVFAIGTVIRLWFVTDVHPPGAHVTSDMWVYDHRAWRLLHGPLDAWDTFTPVGYPALLALVYALAGEHGHVTVGGLQALLGGATAALTHRIGLRLGGHAVVALLASLVVALHFPLVLYTGLLLTEVPSAFLLTLGVWSLLRAVERPGVDRSLLAGLVIGVATVMRPNFVAAYPFVALYLWVALRHDRRAWRRVAALAAFGIALPVIAASVHNTRIANRPVVLATNGGLNFFANFAEVRSIRYDDERGLVHRITPIPNLLLYAAEYDSPRPFHDARFFYSLGWQQIRERPRRLARAFRNVIEGAGLGTQDYWPGWRGHEVLLRRYSLGFGWLVVVPALLAVSWLAVAGRLREPGEALRILLGGAVLSGFATLGLFLGDPRVRVPFDPLLVLLAVDGLVRAARLPFARAA